MEFQLKELQAALVRRDTIITDLRKEKYEVRLKGCVVDLFK